MKGKLLLAVIACTTAECNAAVPSQHWILFLLKIHWYGSQGCPGVGIVWSSPDTLLKRKGRHKNSKEKEVHECSPMEQKQYGAEAKGPRQYWCNTFMPYILSAFWLKDQMPSAILLQVPWHRRLPLPYGLPEICSSMLSHCKKERVQVETEGWPCPRLFKSYNDWVDNLFFWVCHARCLCPRPFLDTC